MAQGGATKGEAARGERDSREATQAAREDAKEGGAQGILSRQLRTSMVCMRLATQYWYQ